MSVQKLNVLGVLRVRVKAKYEIDSKVKVINNKNGIKH